MVVAETSPPRRTPPSWSPSNTRSARRSPTRARRCARARRSVARGARQHRGRLARPGGRSRGQREGGRSSLRHAPTCRARRADEPAHGRRLDGAARRDRKLRCRERQLLLRCCSQSARALRDGLAPILGVPKEKLRVLTEDVGGAFGLKTGPYPEYIAILVGAKKIGRPVHWMSNRAEAFLSDNQARDTYSEAELALDDKRQVPGAARAPSRQYGRLYRRGRRQHPDRQFHALPARHVRHQADRHDREVRVHQHDHHRALSRRRPAGGELHPRTRGRRGRARDRHRSGQAAPAQSRSKPRPCRTRPPSAPPYDSGEFEPILDKALALADYDFKQRRREAAKRGKYRGLGISCMLEHSGGAPIEGA